jgi:hypothetical protein
MWIGWDMVDNVADTMGMRGCGCGGQKWLWLGEWQWFGGSVVYHWKEEEQAVILVPNTPWVAYVDWREMG